MRAAGGHSLPHRSVCLVAGQGQARQRYGTGRGLCSSAPASRETRLPLRVTHSLSLPGSPRCAGSGRSACPTANDDTEAHAEGCLSAEFQSSAGEGCSLGGWKTTCIGLCRCNTKDPELTLGTYLTQQLTRCHSDVNAL